MRRFYALLPLLVGLLLPTVAWAQDDITIDVTHFPDKTFRAYLTSQPYGEDGVLTADELTEVTELLLNNKGIKNLKGIEHFTSLSVLECDSNQLSSLDISKNTNLARLECSFNKLTKLDVSQNPALDWLSCYNNQLTSLDVSSNAKLRIFIFRNNKLTSIDLTNNTKLQYLDCWGNQLPSLDVTQNTALYYIDCDGNKLTSLDVSKNVDLQFLYCPRNQLTSLDLSQNTELLEFECMDNQLTSLDLSHNTKLQYLHCGDNKLASLDVSQNTALQELSCYHCQLSSLDVSGNPQLAVLFCEENLLKEQAMDALIASMPVADDAKIYVKNANGDGNECTSAQIAAIKAKGWTPLFSGVIGNIYQWMTMDTYEASRKNIYTQTIDGVTYILWHQITDKYAINANPETEGGWFYKTKLVLDVEKDGTTQSYLLDDQYFTGEDMDPAYVPAMLFDMDARKLYVFCNSKDYYHDYGMDGFLYESQLDDLQFTKKTVFTRANWGWYSGFMGMREGKPVLTHWSFAGYIAMVTTCSAKGAWTSTKERTFAGHDDYIPIWQSQQHVLVVGNDYGWVTEDQYQAALEAIPTRTKFRIYTMFNSNKYYLTAAGKLTDSFDEAKVFLFSQVKSTSLFASPGWRLSIPFTNPFMTQNATGDIIHEGLLRTNASKRSDWEGQVWFKKGDCYAVRSTNALSMTYGANSFWAVLDVNADGMPEAGYSWEPTFVWQLEKVQEETGVEDLISDTSEGDIIYNLAGQRLTTLQKGLNIVGGKKILVR